MLINYYKKIKHMESYITNRAGSIGLIVALGLLIVVTSIGLMSVTPKTKKGVITATSDVIGDNINYIISYATENKKLPTSIIVKNDKYNQPLIYVYANELASTNNICGNSNTVLSVSGESKAVAVAIISKGEDTALNSTNISSASEQGITSFTTVSLSTSDVYQYLSLQDLQQKIGCYGKTRGKLIILNNELPSVCVGSTNYAAIIYAEGGVPFNETNYKWCIEGSVPSWLSVMPSTTCPTWSTPYANVQLGSASAATAPSTQVTLMVMDSDSPIANTAKRTLSLAVNTNCSEGGGDDDGGSNDSEISFDEALEHFAEYEGYSSAITKDTSSKTLKVGEESTEQSVNANDLWGCVWFPDGQNTVSPCSATSCPIKDKTTRIYFEMQAAYAESETKSNDSSKDDNDSDSDDDFDKFLKNTMSDDDSDKAGKDSKDKDSDKNGKDTTDDDDDKDSDKDKSDKDKKSDDDDDDKNKTDKDKSKLSEHDDDDDKDSDKDKSDKDKKSDDDDDDKNKTDKDKSKLSEHDDDDDKDSDKDKSDKDKKSDDDDDDKNKTDKDKSKLSEHDDDDDKDSDKDKSDKDKKSDDDDDDKNKTDKDKSKLSEHDDDDDKDSDKDKSDKDKKSDDDDDDDKNKTDKDKSKLSEHDDDDDKDSDKDKSDKDKKSDDDDDDDKNKTDKDKSKLSEHDDDDDKDSDKDKSDKDKKSDDDDDDKNKTDKDKSKLSEHDDDDDKDSDKDKSDKDKKSDDDDDDKNKTDKDKSKLSEHDDDDDKDSDKDKSDKDKKSDDDDDDKNKTDKDKSDKDKKSDDDDDDDKNKTDKDKSKLSEHDDDDDKDSDKDKSDKDKKSDDDDDDKNKTDKDKSDKDKKSDDDDDDKNKTDKDKSKLSEHDDDDDKDSDKDKSDKDKKSDDDDDKNKTDKDKSKLSEHDDDDDDDKNKTDKDKSKLSEHDDDDDKDSDKDKSDKDKKSDDDDESDDGDSSLNSTDYKGGFVFAMIEGERAVSTCGGPGNGLGYGRKNNSVGNNIGGYSLGLEFDMYPDSGTKDFYYESSQYYGLEKNHVAMVFNGNNNHTVISLPANPLCPPTADSGNYTCWSGCCHKNGTTGPIWLEDANLHTVRIELHTGCASPDGGNTCSNCDTGAGNYAEYKVWIDAPDSNKLSTDYLDESPFIDKCFYMHYDTMSTIKFGFTTGTDTGKPNNNPFTISKFKINFDDTPSESDVKTDTDAAADANAQAEVQKESAMSDIKAHVVFKNGETQIKADVTGIDCTGNTMNVTTKLLLENSDGTLVDVGLVTNKSDINCSNGKYHATGFVDSNKISSLATDPKAIIDIGLVVINVQFTTAQSKIEIK